MSNYWDDYHTPIGDKDKKQIGMIVVVMAVMVVVVAIIIYSPH